MGTNAALFATCPQSAVCKHAASASSKCKVGQAAFSKHCVCTCRYFDFDKLAEITQQVTRNLNKIIDINYYPVETARRSNTRNRPIGIGVQVSNI